MSTAGFFMLHMLQHFISHVVLIIFGALVMQKYFLFYCGIVACVIVNAQVNDTIQLKDKLYHEGNAHRQSIRFVSLRTGNDLFTIAGLIGARFPPSENPFREGGFVFQPNRDRDHTASFAIDVGTDYLRPLAKGRKSYQVLSYGFDLFTPYYKDSSIFNRDTSYNVLDRPHASFQYFGWSVNALSANERFRWEAGLKIGRVGGRIGQRIQDVIHETISRSVPGVGWGAQIGASGYSTVLLEGKQEWLLKADRRSALGSLNIMAVAQETVGGYQTFAAVGLRIGNRSFNRTNMHQLTILPVGSNKSVWQRIVYHVGADVRYVLHNTMLEGPGVFSTSKVKAGKEIFVLPASKVRRLTAMLYTSISYQAKSFSFFYNWYSNSPETRQGIIGLMSPSGRQPMDISRRWHHFAEIGMSIKMRPAEARRH